MPDEPSKRRPDDDVGNPGTPAAGGGHHTAEQSAITDMGSGGRSDAERSETWGNPAPDPVPIGGSSGGHSDQVAAAGPRSGERVARGGYKADRGTS